MATVMQTRRAATAARWAAAFQRALDNGLDVLIAADNGERFVTSASQLDTIHRTDGVVCSCAAAVAGDPVCQHRAVVRYVLGTLPVVVVHVDDLQEVESLQRCRRCFGEGEHWAGSPADGDSRRIVCPACRGSGHAPQVPVLLPAPSPVAAASAVA